MLETPRQAGRQGCRVATWLTMPGMEMPRRMTAQRKHPTQLNCASGTGNIAWLKVWVKV